MAKYHGPSIKNDEQYEELRKKGMSKEKAVPVLLTILIPEKKAERQISMKKEQKKSYLKRQKKWVLKGEAI